jgi:hypothetical protein
VKRETAFLLGMLGLFASGSYLLLEHPVEVARFINEHWCEDCKDLHFTGLEKLTCGLRRAERRITGGGS